MLLRSGKIMKIPFSIKCSLPKIDISCKLFDFGNVAVDIETELIPFTISNNQGEDLELVLDLKGNESDFAKYIRIRYDSAIADQIKFVEGKVV